MSRIKESRGNPKFMELQEHYKLRCTANDHPIPIDHKDRIAALYPNCVFNERKNFKNRE